MLSLVTFKWSTRSVRVFRVQFISTHSNSVSIQTARICNHTVSYTASHIIAMTHERIGTFYLSLSVSPICCLFVRAFIHFWSFDFQERERQRKKPVITCSQQKHKQSKFYHYYALAAICRKEWFIHLNILWNIIQVNSKERKRQRNPSNRKFLWLLVKAIE